MPYIGNTVQNQGFTPAIDYFSGNGTTVTFTLTRPVASVAQMIVAVDNVIQNPSTAFTVAGNAITFTSAPLSGTNNIWVEYTSLITTYAAISQSPSVIGDITATGGYLATGSFGASFVDGTIIDYVTGNGRITTGPADGLTLYTGGTSARTALAAWDTSGNLTNTGTGSFTGGLGVNATLQTWYGSEKPIQVGYGASLTGRTNTYSELNLYGNSFTNAAGTTKYIGADYAQLYSMSGGAHYWYTAPSGSAGATCTFTNQMKLDNSGRLTIPNQVAFHVRVNNDNYITTSPVPFSNAVYNVGSSWNTSTYTFTAPTGGRYMFLLQWYGRISTANNGSTMRLLVNGSQRQYSDMTLSSATTYLPLPLISTLNLGTGDTVQITWSGNAGGAYYGGNQEMNLFGWLLG